MRTLKISDSAEGADGGTHSTPVAELAILARRHEILTASITGVLIEGPVSIHDIARVNAAALETFMNGLAVITEFHHLTLEIWPIIDPNAVGSITFLQNNVFKSLKSTTRGLHTVGTESNIVFFVWQNSKLQRWNNVLTIK